MENTDIKINLIKENADTNYMAYCRLMKKSKEPFQYDKNFDYKQFEQKYYLKKALEQNEEIKQKKKKQRNKELQKMSSYLYE